MWFKTAFDWKRGLMKPDISLSRRDFITSVSVLAIATSILPGTVERRVSAQDEFVLVNGWVLKRSEVA